MTTTLLNPEALPSWTGLDRLHALLDEDPEGASLTLVVRTPDGERTVGRHDSAGHEALPWIAEALEEHGQVPGLDRVRVRRWLAGGRPLGGVVLKPAPEAASESPSPASPAVGSAVIDQLRAERDRAVAQLAEAKDRIRRLKGALVTRRAQVRDGKDRIAALEAELAERQALEDEAARLIFKLRRDNAHWRRGVDRINEALTELDGA